jgi:hypothetical protein
MAKQPHSFKTICSVLYPDTPEQARSLCGQSYFRSLHTVSEDIGVSRPSSISPPISPPAIIFALISVIDRVNTEEFSLCIEKKKTRWTRLEDF